MTRAGRRWVAVAVAALAAAWALAPSVVPIYDGLSNPDEPYRYVAAPPGSQSTKPPTKAVAHVVVRNGQTGAAYANSAENGPQISLYLPAGALSVPGGANQITVTATPMAPVPPLPQDGTIWSNVYRITATAGGVASHVIGKGPATPTIQMRAPSAQQPQPAFEYRVGDQWQPVRTLRVGNDIYQATAPVFGDWALVRLTRAASGSSSGGGVNVGLLAAGIAVLLIAAAIVAVRFSRTRRASG